MANSLSVMTNVLRNVVSKQRIRYKEKGFNLDLAYICDNIIAMGYPADNIESIYRNRLEDVYKFLEENHRDHYKIYNLCLERSYDINKFHGRVAVYPFEDHNPPTIELIQRFCNDVDCWLKADGLNVAAVHCKAGKGRTGTMICCYLLYSGQQSTAEDALSCYDEKRTKDRKGVTIPSQRRYVQYFSKLIRSGLQYERQTLQLCEIRFTEATLLHSQGSVHCSISVLQDTPCSLKVQPLQNLTIDFRKCFTLDIKNPSLSVAGDIKVELTHKTSRKKIFHFWFNTFFVRDAADMEGAGDDAKFVYTLNKCEIDDAHKDKDHKYFSEDFKVQLVFCADSPAGPGRRCVINNIGNHNVSQGPHLRQNNYMLPQNNSSGNDLNNICDQKSSSSASVSSLNFVGCEESGGVEEVRNSYKRAGGNSQLVYGSPGCEEHSSTSGDTASQLPLTPPPSYAHFNDIDGDIQWQSKTISPQQHQVFIKASVTATSTPNQQDKAMHMYPVCQRQQQYQPYSSVPKFDRDSVSNNTNTSVQSSSQTHSHHTSNSSKNSSKSSSISSHSSTSVVGDNEEEWESASTQITQYPGNATTTTLTKLPTPTFVCDSANYVLLPSTKEVHMHPYLCKHRATSNGSGVPTKCSLDQAPHVEDVTASSPQHHKNLLSNSSMVLLQHPANLPCGSVFSTKAVISKNQKSRPRRETT